TLYEVITALRPKWERGQIQGHLGRFGFSGQEVLRRADSLSGGERARLALAILMLSRANLLILDEPTNHLDVESIEALEDAIEEYDGTVILVSHDRALLRALTTRVWAFDGTHLEDYGGPFVEWEQHAAERAARRTAAEAVEAAAARKAARAEAAKAPERNTDSLRRTAERDAAAREKDVHRLEAKISELEALLADPALYGGGA